MNTVLWEVPNRFCLCEHMLRKKTLVVWAADNQRKVIFDDGMKIARFGFNDGRKIDVDQREITFE